MAISFGTGGGVKEMQVWYNADTTGGWGGANDGLEGTGAQIEGNDCIIAALRKNENVSITYSGTLTNIPTGSVYIANFYTSIGSILTSLDVDVNDGATGTANFNILSEFTGDARITLKQFIPIAFDLSAGTLNVVTNDLSDMSFNINVQNVNVKAADNQFWDIAHVGNGLTLVGTTVGNQLFTEAQSFDVTNDDHIGVLQAFEGVIFAQHNVDINTTTGNSSNETLTFVETTHGTNNYTLGGTGTAVFNGTSIASTGTVTFVMDMSSMSAFTMTAGSVNKATTVTFGANTISRVNFSNITTINSGTGTFASNTLDTVTTVNLQTDNTETRLQDCTNINLSNNADLTDANITSSGSIALGATGSATSSLTRCTFTDPSGTEAVNIVFPGSALDVNKVTDCTFVRTTGTTNAVDLGNVGSNTSIDWNGNTLTGYGAQTAGNNISSTANGAIAVNFTVNSILTINVLNGATIPTVEISGTGTVNIVASVTVTISGLLGNTEVSVLENPSPYTQTLAEQQAGAGPVSLFNEDFVSAVTGTDILVDTESGANVTRITSTTTDFTDMTGLVAGDFIRVTERVSGQNLRTFDTFEVVSVATNTIDVVDVASSTLVQQNIIDTTGDTITVEKIDASYNFSVASGEVVDILLFRVGSLPIFLLNQTISSTNNSFPVSQSLDRNFEV